MVCSRRGQTLYSVCASGKVRRAKSVADTTHQSVICKLGKGGVDPSQVRILVQNAQRDALRREVGHAVDHLQRTGRAPPVASGPHKQHLVANRRAVADERDLGGGAPERPCQRACFGLSALTKKDARLAAAVSASRDEGPRQSLEQLPIFRCTIARPTRQHAHLCTSPRPGK